MVIQMMVIKRFKIIINLVNKLDKVDDEVEKKEEHITFLLLLLLP